MIPAPLRVVLVPVFAVAILLLYGYALAFFAQALPRGGSAVYGYVYLFAQGFLSASLVALVFTYPLAFVYRHNGFVAALFTTLPVLYLRLPELLEDSRSLVARLVSTYEVAAFIVLLVLGTALAHRHLLRFSRRE